jgi:hypothetical protein
MSIPDRPSIVHVVVGGDHGVPSGRRSCADEPEARRRTMEPPAVSKGHANGPTSPVYSLNPTGEGTLKNDIVPIGSRMSSRRTAPRGAPPIESMRSSNLCKIESVDEFCRHESVWYDVRSR